MSLKEALDFFDKVDALNYECAERIAVGTDHIEWLIKETREAVKDLELLDECIDHLEYCNYGDKWESECAEQLKKQVEKYQSKHPPK